MLENQVADKGKIISQQLKDTGSSVRNLSTRCMSACLLPDCLIACQPAVQLVSVCLPCRVSVTASVPAFFCFLSLCLAFCSFSSLLSGSASPFPCLLPSPRLFSFVPFPTVSGHFPVSSQAIYGQGTFMPCSTPLPPRRRTARVSILCALTRPRPPRPPLAGWNGGGAGPAQPGEPPPPPRTPAALPLLVSIFRLAGSNLHPISSHPKKGLSFVS
jgi:hypothetical protein